MINYLVIILTNVAIFGIITLGLDVQWGWAGLLDLTFFAFAACGAYAYAVFALPPHGPTPPIYILGFNWPIPLAILAAVVVTGLLAAVIGYVGLRRLRPEYLAIVTLSVGLLLMQIVTQQQSLLDGTDGLFGIPTPFATASPSVFLGFCVVLLALCVLLLQRLHKSGFGRAVRASRDSAPAAQAFGYNVFQMRQKAFVLGALFAGLGGALLAAYLTAFNTGAWAPAETFLLFVAVLIGGRGRPLGVLVGVALITGVLQEVTRFLPEIPGNPGGVAALRMVLIGGLMIAALRLRPQGILPERPSVTGNPAAVLADPPVPAVPASRDMHEEAKPRSGLDGPVDGIALEAAHISKGFGGVQAVADCSFRVRSGTITGLIGPNGAGKSTMVEIVSGFVRPDSGTVTFRGHSITKRPPHRIAKRGVCRSFQKAREWGSMTVLENLLVAGAPAPASGLLRSLIQGRRYHRRVTSDIGLAEAILDRVGLGRMAAEKAGSLSGGQRRLLDFGRILMARPSLVLLDEPLAGVNPTLHPVIGQFIRELRAGGITVLLIEHNLDFVDELCDEVIVMAEGAPIAQGPLPALRQDRRVVDAYLGGATVDV
jgi:ABC-type branched-subunit amino acid transport system ATPase component/ABC-type branched-subunit amino acid transport system permease subunit